MGPALRLLADDAQKCDSTSWCAAPVVSRKVVSVFVDVSQFVCLCVCLGSQSVCVGVSESVCVSVI